MIATLFDFSSIIFGAIPSLPLLFSFSFKKRWMSTQQVYVLGVEDFTIGQARSLHWGMGTGQH